MIYKYRIASTTSSSKDEPPKQSGEKLQSTSPGKQLKGKTGKPDSSDK